MAKISYKLSFLCVVLALSACQYSNVQPAVSGNAEQLIDLSSESVSVGLASKGALTKLTSVVAKDAPAKAVLNCSLKSAVCAQAKEILERRSIPVQMGGEKSNSVALSYERVVVRDCNPRYIDNNHDSEGRPYSSFGCAMSANMVQMVGDKQQFVNPAILDLPEAGKAQQVYKAYRTAEPTAASSASSGGGSSSSSGSGSSSSSK